MCQFSGSMTTQEIGHLNGSMDKRWLWFERNWGLHLRYSSPSHQSKSPLWAHLMAYAETQGKEEFVSPLSPSTSSPPHPLTSSMSSLAFLSTGASESALLQTRTHTLAATCTCASLLLPPSALQSGSPEESPRSAQNLKAHFRRRRFQSPQLRAQVEAILHPPPSSLISDLL